MPIFDDQGVLQLAYLEQNEIELLNLEDRIPRLWSWQ